MEPKSMLIIILCMLVWDKSSHKKSNHYISFISVHGPKSTKFSTLVKHLSASLWYIMKFIKNNLSRLMLTFRSRLKPSSE